MHKQVRLYLAICLVAFCAAFVVQTGFQFLGAERSAWGGNAGWQREIAFWNVAAASIVFLTIRLADERLACPVVIGCTVLFFLLGANHLHAFMSEPQADFHWPPLVLNLIGFAFGARLIVAMRALELKVPPPIVGLLVALAMWFLCWTAPSEPLPMARFVGVAGLVAVGGAFGFAGVIAFRRARTTVNPLKPESSSSLVHDGVYKMTRNPMYVGMLFLLLAWATFLWSPWSLLGPLAFTLYIGRFQIAPEERVLAGLFGAEYANYKARVRRWL